MGDGRGEAMAEEPLLNYKGIPIAGPPSSVPQIRRGEALRRKLRSLTTPVSVMSFAKSVSFSSGGSFCSARANAVA